MDMDNSEKGLEAAAIVGIWSGTSLSELSQEEIDLIGGGGGTEVCSSDGTTSFCKRD